MGGHYDHWGLTGNFMKKNVWKLLSIITMRENEQVEDGRHIYQNNKLFIINKIKLILIKLIRNVYQGWFTVLI